MPTWGKNADPFDHTDAFVDRHLGPRAKDAETMLEALGLGSLEELIDRAVPRVIRTEGRLDLPRPTSEQGVLDELRGLAEQNQVLRSFIGMGYHGTITPPVIQRNVLEDPGWYTQYTPYQPEISQGRLEALLNFQTMVCDLTGMEVANASMLDEGTAAAEAMTLCLRVSRRKAPGVFLVSERCHPQTIDVVQTRARPLGIEVVVADVLAWDFSRPTFGVLVQYPATCGVVEDYEDLCARAHAADALVVAATDLLALTLLREPGAWGADVAVGNSQRFGVPMGFGGPHAGFLATKEPHKRQVPGRIVGVSKDAHGRTALRLALQTREQHIRREKATSNICTAQVLLAVMASLYAVYHGPEGLTRIARRVRRMTCLLGDALAGLGCRLHSQVFFDTLRVAPPGPADDARTTQATILAQARAAGVNLRAYDDGSIGIALDETASPDDLAVIVRAFGGSDGWRADPSFAQDHLPEPHRRSSAFLAHEVFQRYRSETELMRYVQRLKARDLSLTTSMIPLGSCTMKLNATAEMLPVTWRGFGALHPFAPLDQAQGYLTLFQRLEAWLAEITGFARVSLQPNAGSQGEYAGLLAIQGYHRARGEGHRDVCLIPSSAHGTNPASAALAGLRVVVVACDEQGNVDLGDLRKKAEQHRDALAALMITYPSTHGVFEEGVRDICAAVHEHGGQVYLDGANMNALVGVAKVGEIGADVAHLNLHKTFCIPHGGGGPGMGPIGVAAHLAPYLPSHPVVAMPGAGSTGAVSAAPWGSPSILVIPYAFIAMMGAEGLLRATQVAILNANYVARRLEPHYPVLYKGKHGLVAHECIVDLRPLKQSAGIEADDVAKRLMDYGFHAPTMHFPVMGTLMIEPTESESKEELDRFVDALIAIREEVRAVEEGRLPRDDNPLKNAPHTADLVTADAWTHPYPREQAAFPAPWTREHKFWPSVSRIDGAYGDRNFVCTCPPMEEYAVAGA